MIVLQIFAKTCLNTQHGTFCLHGNVSAWLQASVDSVVRNYKTRGRMCLFFFSWKRKYFEQLEIHLI